MTPAHQLPPAAKFSSAFFIRCARARKESYYRDASLLKPIAALAIPNMSVENANGGASAALSHVKRWLWWGARVVITFSATILFWFLSWTYQIFKAVMTIVTDPVKFLYRKFLQRLARLLFPKLFKRSSKKVYTHRL